MDGLDGLGRKSPGGVKYRAAYAAEKNLSTVRLYHHGAISVWMDGLGVDISGRGEV